MCALHGWQSSTCPECLYRNTYDQRGAEKAAEAALTLIDARPFQQRLLALYWEEFGFLRALELARQWQNPLPLPVVFCNF